MAGESWGVILWNIGHVNGHTVIGLADSIGLSVYDTGIYLGRRYGWDTCAGRTGNVANATSLERSSAGKQSAQVTINCYDVQLQPPEPPPGITNGNH